MQPGEHYKIVVQAMQAVSGLYAACGAINE